MAKSSENFLSIRSLLYDSVARIMYAIRINMSHGTQIVSEVINISLCNQMDFCTNTQHRHSAILNFPKFVN